MDADLVVGLFCCLVVPALVAVVCVRWFRRRGARRRAGVAAAALARAGPDAVGTAIRAGSEALG